MDAPISHSTQKAEESTFSSGCGPQLLPLATIIARGGIELEYDYDLAKFRPNRTMGKREIDQELQEPALDAAEQSAEHAPPAWSPPAGATRTGLVGTSSAQSGELGLAHTLHSGSFDGGAMGGSPPAHGDQEAPLPVGAIVGQRYRIEEHISSGGFGAVYRATDKEIHHHNVALKLLHNPAADDAARSEAMRELALIASVSHPSVVQFKDYGWHEGRLWFAMPWYHGHTLDQRYTGTSISRDEARPLFERLAQGLAAMHAVGVHHQDIKPENVFVAEIAGFEGGLPVLLDLGIATRRGEVPKGFTLDYAAPETAAAALGELGDPIGEAADVFSLALVLRNLLEPESQTFTDESAMLPFLHARATKPLRPPRRKDCRYLAPYFNRWLNLDPNKRPSASEFAAELACLTEPEELRAARMRVLKRIVPVVLMAAASVAVLWTQVQRQEQEIQKQQDQLQEQSKESAVLRETSEEQLQKLESQDQKLGDQRAQLARAIGIARKLSTQLESTENSRQQGVRKIRALTKERNDLTGERDALSTERDNLLVQRDKITSERDSLSKKLVATAAARDVLQLQYAELSTRADTLQASLQATSKELREAEQSRDDLQKRLQSSEQELTAKVSTLAELQSQKDALDQSLDEANKQLEAKQQKIRTLHDELDTAKAAKASEPPPKPTASADSADPNAQ